MHIILLSRFHFVTSCRVYISFEEFFSNSFQSYNPQICYFFRCWHQQFINDILKAIKLLLNCLLPEQILSWVWMHALNHSLIACKYGSERHFFEFDLCPNSVHALLALCTMNHNGRCSISIYHLRIVLFNSPVIGKCNICHTGFCLELTGIAAFPERHIGKEAFHVAILSRLHGIICSVVELAGQTESTP